MFPVDADDRANLGSDAEKPPAGAVPADNGDQSEVRDVGLQARTTSELPLDIAAQSSTTPPFAVGADGGPDRTWIRRGLAVGQSFQAHPWLGRIGQTTLVLLTIGAVVMAWRTRAVDTEATPVESAVEIEADPSTSAGGSASTVDGDRPPSSEPAAREDEPETPTATGRFDAAPPSFEGTAVSEDEADSSDDAGDEAPGPGGEDPPPATTTTAAPPIQLPVGNQVVNGGFEQPQVADGAFAFLTTPGWNSSDGDLEVWAGHRGVNAFQGRQFVELNARQPLSITQVVSVTSGFQYRWSVAHRGREDDDTIQILINNNLVATVTSSPDRWQSTEGLIDVPRGQDRVIITLRAVDEGSSGNFVDEVSLIAVAALP